MNRVVRLWPINAYARVSEGVISNLVGVADAVKE